MKDVYKSISDSWIDEGAGCLTRDEIDRLYVAEIAEINNRVIGPVDIFGEPQDPETTRMWLILRAERKHWIARANI